VTYCPATMQQRFGPQSLLPSQMTKGVFCGSPDGHAPQWKLPRLAQQPSLPLAQVKSVPQATMPLICTGVLQWGCPPVPQVCGQLFEIQLPLPSHVCRML